MPESRKPVIFCLVGPTAAGKTAAAIRLAEQQAFDIVSVDSAMVYRHMDIGTAKPEAAVLARYPHRLVDILDPWEAYSAGRFRDDALREIRTILAAGRRPLLVGGTFLYLRALEQGLAELPGADAELRDAIDARGTERGWPALHAELARLDPATAARLRPNDRQRIQRALEVIELTGEPMSALLGQAQPVVSDYRYERIALLPSSRTVLHARVEERFDAMLSAGLIEEVEKLRQMPDMHADRASMRAVGYRQVWAHLEGSTDRDEARRQAIVATRRLIKRQLTWLRAEPGRVEFDCLDSAMPDRVANYVAERLDA